MSGSVNIAINGRFLGARATGVQRVARNLVKALDLNGALGGGGLQAEIVLPRGQNASLDLDNIATRRIGQLQGPAWEQFELGTDRRSTNLVNLCNAAPLLKESAVTMIHDAQVFLSPQSYSAAFVRWYRFSLPRIAARSRRVLTVSQFSRRMLARFEVSPEENTDVVYNGVDHVLDTPAQPEIVERLGLSSRNYVLVFGSLQDHKNLRVVLQAFQAPSLRDLRLLIVGDIDAAAILAKFGAPLPRGAVVSGRVTDGQLRGLLERAMCIAYPSLTEGFGLPPLEAMALGCPAVVAPTGALPEVCGDSVLYADPQDPQAWTDAIGRIACDTGLRKSLAARGLIQARKFTWRASAAKLHGIIRESAI